MEKYYGITSSEYGVTPVALKVRAHSSEQFVLNQRALHTMYVWAALEFDARSAAVSRGNFNFSCARRHTRGRYPSLVNGERLKCRTQRPCIHIVCFCFVSSNLALPTGFFAGRRPNETALQKHRRDCRFK